MVFNLVEKGDTVLVSGNFSARREISKGAIHGEDKLLKQLD